MSRTFGRQNPTRLVNLSVIAVMAVGLLSLTSAMPAAIARTHSGALALDPSVKGAKFISKSAPTDADCRADPSFAGPCYSPQEIRQAYGLTPILNAGFTGKGQTIVIIDSFGSPTLANDLHVFDADYGLPNPPSLSVLAPLGTVAFDPTNNDMINWAFETTLDVEWAHAMAPGAAIVLMTSPVDETEGVQGLPEFLALEKYALDHHLGKIISQSWGATENTLFDTPGKKVLNDFEHFYERARSEQVTVLASSGDTGSTNFDLNFNLYPQRVVGFPASSPLVTAVGGTSLSADTSGNYQSETVWDNFTGASGGGVSQVFAEPDYQLVLPKSDQSLLGHHRGMPDLSFNADPLTSILVYISIPVTGLPAGYYGIGGTSEGSPQWAGIIADTNQLAGHSMGFLNLKLYLLGKSGLLYRGFHDVTTGNNGFGGVPGYNATAGWDLSTGWGTPNLSNFVRALAGMKD